MSVNDNYQYSVYVIENNVAEDQNVPNVHRIDYVRNKMSQPHTAIRAYQDAYCVENVQPIRTIDLVKKGICIDNTKPKELQYEMLKNR